MTEQANTPRPKARKQLRTLLKRLIRFRSKKQATEAKRREEVSQRTSQTNAPASRNDATVAKSSVADDISMSSARSGAKKEHFVASAANSERASVASSNKKNKSDGSMVSSKKLSLLQVNSFSSRASRQSTGNSKAEASVASTGSSKRKGMPVVDSIVTLDDASLASSIHDLSVCSNPSFFRKGSRGLEVIPEEVQAELSKLKAQATKISLTNHDGTKEHTSKSFLEGSFADNPNLWKLSFKESSPTLPLSELEDLEINVGGNFFTTFRGDATEGFVEEVKTNMVSLCLEDRLWLSLSLSGIPSEEMEKMKAADPTKMFGLLASFAAQTKNKATFVVDEIQFFCAAFPGLMSHVKLSHEQKEKHEADLNDHRFLGHIVFMMQEYGNTDSEREVADKASEILDVLMDLGIDSSDDRLGGFIRPMMAAQAEGNKDLMKVTLFSNVVELAA